LEVTANLAEGNRVVPCVAPRLAEPQVDDVGLEIANEEECDAK